VLRDQGKYEEAEETYPQAFGLMEKVLDKQHPSTLTSMDNLAVVLSNQAGYEQAKETYRQALGLNATSIARALCHFAPVSPEMQRQDHAGREYHLVWTIESMLRLSKGNNNGVLPF
jgi:tetratricopeptide (TPR) repeat protein